MRVISDYNLLCKKIIIKQKKHQFDFIVNMYVDKLLRIILMVYLNSLLYLIGTHVYKVKKLATNIKDKPAKPVMFK